MKRVRVRKARHSGTCPACRRLVLVGDLIASVRGGPFMCIAHVTRQDTDGRAAPTVDGPVATVTVDGPDGPSLTHGR